MRNMSRKRKQTVEDCDSIPQRKKRNVIVNFAPYEKCILPKMKGINFIYLLWN